MSPPPIPAPAQTPGLLYRAKYNNISNLKSDGVRLTDVNTTSGSTSITSASYVFTQADVGKIIGIVNVRGANPPAGPGPLTSLTTNQPQVNGPLNATILSVTTGSGAGGTAAVLSTAASVTQANCFAQFGTDDTASLNALIAGIPAIAHASIQIEGITMVSSQVTLKSYVSLKGQGRYATAVVWINPNTMTNPVFWGGLVSGTPTSVLYSNIGFYDFEIDCSCAIDSGVVSQKAISLPFGQDITIKNMYVHDTPATAIATDSNIRNYITGCRIDNPGRCSNNAAYGTTPGHSGIGIGVGGLSYESYIITDNFITNPGHWCIFFEEQTANVVAPASYALVSGNICNVTFGRNPGGGIGDCGLQYFECIGNTIIGPGSGSYPNQYGIASMYGSYKINGYNPGTPGIRGKIQGNTIIGTTSGIAIDQAAQGNTVNYPTGTVVDYDISGNSIFNTITYGMYFEPGDSIPLGGLNVKNNLIVGSGRAGIAFLDVAGGPGTANLGCQDVNLIGNTIKNSSLLSTAVPGGISVYGCNINRLRMIGNAIYDDQSTQTQSYALYINSGCSVTDAFIVDNDLHNNLTSAISGAGTLSGWVSNNKGYNPLGATSVTFGASPATYTAGNTYETLYVTATTVTSVTKGGVSLPLAAGATSAQIALSPGQSAIITYTGTASAVTDRQ